MVKWYVYIVRCSDDTLYTGITTNVIKRVDIHNKKKGAKYTRTRTPVVLLEFVEVESKSEALKLEYKIKKLKKDLKVDFIKNYGKTEL